MVISQIITVERVITATTTDFLAGTQLDQPGVPGVYSIWTVSDQVDTTVTVSLGGRTLTDASVVVQRTQSIIAEDQDSPLQVLSITAGRPVISIVEATAAIIRVRVRFLPAIAT